MADSDDLDSLVGRVDPDRWLSSRFIADPAARADVIALYAFDHELARAPKVASNPLLGEIRLTWWGEALDEIFEGRAVRRHPAAQALAEAVARRQLRQAPLQGLIEARYRELDPQPLDTADALAWARETAGRTAALAVAVLDPQGDGERAVAAGAAWALSRRPEPCDAFEPLLAQAKRDVRGVSAAAFPAVAHAVFATRRAADGSANALARRLRITWAVALGRI